MSDFAEGFERDLSVIDNVVGDHIDRRRRLFADCSGQLIRMRAGGLTHRHDPGARKPDALFDRRAIRGHVPRLDDDFVLEPTRIG